MEVEILPVPDSDFDRGQGTSAFRLPPDKSIFHRILLIGSLTHSQIRIPIESPHSISHDIIATVLALESLGVPIEVVDDAIELQGVGKYGYRTPSHLINCANSGTTARLLIGLLAGQRFSSALIGDPSLSLRPMQRLTDLLVHKMKAKIITAPEGTLPLTIHGTPLEGQSITLPVVSAQMKSAVLLAGLFASGGTSVIEPWPTRNHTEKMLEAFGLECTHTELGIGVSGEADFDVDDEFTYDIPGDLSSAAFLIAATILIGRELVLSNVLLNESRTRFLDILTLMGVQLEFTNITEEWGEARGTITVGAGHIPLSPFAISGLDSALLIDELPILSVLAMFANGESIIRGAEELRMKESDRIHCVAEQLRAWGVEVEEFDDGLSIIGVPDRQLIAAPIEHAGDHRLAMAFSVALLKSSSATVIPHPEIINISYPQFFDHLSQLTGGQVRITANAA